LATWRPPSVRGRQFIIRSLKAKYLMLHGTRFTAIPLVYLMFSSCPADIRIKDVFIFMSEASHDYINLSGGQLNQGL
jgi:hypothetical protein